MAKVKVDQVLLRARKHARKGEVAEARALYQSVLATFPQNARAKKALALLDSNRHGTPQTMENDPPREQLEVLVGHMRNGQQDQAYALAYTLLARHPNSYVLWNIAGTVYKKFEDVAKAEHAFRKAVALNSDFYSSQYNLGLLLTETGRFADAIAPLRRATRLKPDFNDAWFTLGNALSEIGQHGDAIAAFQQLLSRQPSNAAAHNNLGNALRAQYNYTEAIAAFQNALQIQPDFAEAYNNLGVTQKDLGRTNAALSSFRQALEVSPDYASAHSNMGSMLYELGQHNEAVAAFDRAIKLRPNHANTHYHRGVTLRVLGQLDEAVAAFERAVQLQPDLAEAEAKLLHQMQNISDWRCYDQMEEACQRLGLTTSAVTPFSLLSMEDNAERHMHRARNWARSTFKHTALPPSARPAARPERLRIGYFSPDFHNHPCLYLMMGMLLNHDRSRFEIHVFSYSKTKTGNLRQRAAETVDHFIDVADMADDAIADLARSHALDIAIDLTGYTNHSRSELFQLGLAPIQMNYLGYPGTMGADFIDYIVADPTVIPADQRPFYTENVITLPHSYLSNDNTLEIAQDPTTRADFNLPEDALVLCCFNNNYKISPREFDIWMRVLGQVEDSVLWLLKSNAWSEANLRKEAAARGIDPARLVFAEKVPNAAHLARHKHADLFLDTFNYNAHTTASEALWTGVPLVTKMGTQFAARVAASLLKSIGLPELITTTEAEYEALILDLATDRDTLHNLREKLAANRLSQPLFHSEQNTRAFEDGLQRAYDLYFDGHAPQDITIAAKQR